MPQGPTPRQLARAENIARIKALALTQLAETGAATLSLRAIARDLNIVSSGIYRYYPSRDDLITALVVDAYTDLADTLESASSPRRSPRRRWTDTAHALRTWAQAEPARFTLVYGSVIPGYTAPADTIVPAGRVVAAFLGVASHGAAVAAGHRLPAVLVGELAGLGDAFGVVAGPETLLAHTGAFAQLVGLLTLELGGHFVGGFATVGPLYVALVERLADAVGL